MRAFRICSSLAVAALGGASFGQVVLDAHAPPPNNGGSPGWAMFFDLHAIGSGLTVTHLVTASTAAANAGFSVEVFTRSGTALGGPVGSGPGSSPAGWTSLGVAAATQGSTGSTGVSLPIDIPDIFVGGGGTVGVAVRFAVAGPRYYGTGSPPYSTYSDGVLSLTTGDSRSAPFTTGGSFFTSRALVGSVTYTPVPEPASLLALGIGAAGTLLRRRQRN